MQEPTRQSDLNLLWGPFKVKVERLIAAMVKRGFDPRPFETLRSPQRQAWLYGIGRTHQLQRKPVTWVKKSIHQAGKACDVISRSRLWDWPEFYSALKQEANALGLVVLKIERCHVQYK